MQQIKIFEAWGAAEIAGMEKAVNDWIAVNRVGVVSITPQLCSVGSAASELYQYLLVTVVFKPSR